MTMDMRPLWPQHCSLQKWRELKAQKLEAEPGWPVCCTLLISVGVPCVAKINRSSQFVGTLCVTEPRLGSLCVTDVTLPSSLGKLLCCRRKKANLLTNTGH